MNEIKILSDRIIMDGHADTREQCETATLLANLLLAQGSGFNCVEYRSGYAEFKKSDVVKLADMELMFDPARSTLTVNMDSNIVSVTGVNVSTGSDIVWSSSGEQTLTVDDGTAYVFNIAFASGYMADTIQFVPSDEYSGTLTAQTDSSFTITAGAGGIGGTITLTSKQAGSGETWVLNDTINVSTNFAYTINFTSNNYSCNTIQSVKDGFVRALQYETNDGQTLGVYSDEDGATSWTDQAYRTITFSTSPTGDLLTWLQANGTKRGATLGSLAIGSKIKISHSVLGDIIFLKADKDHDGYPSNSTTLITEKVILLRAFDAKEPNNSNSNRKSYGNNKYSVSNLDQWLNSSAAAGQWYSARHSADQAPNNANVWNNYNEYDQDAGFLAGFDAAFVAALKDTTLKVALNTVTDGGGYESVTRKFFLPSKAELFGVSENGVIEGILLSYFSANTNAVRIAQLSAYAAAHSEYSATAGNNWYYWLRTPNSSISCSVRGVGLDGSLGGHDAYYGGRGVRPLCNLDSGISVSDSTDSDGCYSLQFSGGDKMTINVTKPAGVVLKTQGKYCAEDITVVPTLEEKSVTPTESAQEIVPSDGKCGLSKVTVGAVQTETKSVTPTTSAQTVTPTSGKYLKSVSVGAVPTETKTVTAGTSNTTVTPTSGKFLSQVTVQPTPTETADVTPSKGKQTVQPTSGKYFSSVTVEPIPDDYVIPSGTQQITANGTYDVSGKASAVVNVEPKLETKVVDITENGTTEVTPTTGKDGMSKVTVNVNVPSSGGVEEVATASAMDALLVEANVGKYYKFTGTTDSNYTNGDLYLVEGGQ